MNALKFCLIFISFSFLAFKAKSQTCSGSLGDPIVGAGSDFGTGQSQIGSQLNNGITTYTFVNRAPDDGQYTIAKSTANLNDGWLQNIVNHTPNDPNGYMMVVNASNSPGIFYQNTVANLCPNTTYEFSAWVINILGYPGIKPNVKFIIENTLNNVTTVLKEFNTGDIVEGSARDWKQYGTIFATPSNVGIITLRMLNNNPGGIGNDLALDDIAFRACGPLLTSNTNGAPNNMVQLCENDVSTVTRLTVQLSAGYNNPTQVWQRFNNNIWTNLPAETNSRIDVLAADLSVGDNLFRLIVAEGNNISSENCRIASSVFNIFKNAAPVLNLPTTLKVCEGNTLLLSTNSAAGETYAWTGPNGFTSTGSSINIANANLGLAGNYTLTAKGITNCISTANVNVEILPRLIVGGSTGSTKICEGTSLQIFATGGTTYRWSPIVGLSDPNIANPIATPASTTTYTAVVSNGGCERSISITINILKNSLANAGDDKRIVSGDAITLNGAVTGDNVVYHWEPEEGLDDPTKLNPIATPTKDATYTLVAQSDCNISTDEVKVSVLQQVEIPNSFTPNGDAINDVWNIEATKVIENTKLLVFNRGGQIVYDSRITKAPWDGKNKGKDVSVGTYYYTLNLGSNYKTYTGWVLVTR